MGSKFTPENSFYHERVLKNNRTKISIWLNRFIITIDDWCFLFVTDSCFATDSKIPEKVYDFLKYVPTIIHIQ